MQETFEGLGLSEEIVTALTEASIVEPTEIQRLTIPTLLEKTTDFIGLAQTGTGKTAAFGLPLIERTDVNAHYTQSVVLAPTRELVQQIAVGLKSFGKYKRGLNIEVVFGGAPIMNQIKSIKKNTPQILVATPGRLIDLLKRKVLKFEDINTVVLDEADEMLNMGFKEDIYEILSFVENERHIWLFSATMAKEIRGIVNEFMESPEELTVNSSQKVNKNIAHCYSSVKASDKARALERFIDYSPDMYGVVFCRTKMDTQRLADQLVRNGYTAEALHGDLTQKQRDSVMGRFRVKAVKILVATDVAARGIDVEDLTHVFHFSLPDDMAFYAHRSGRTARAGKKGVSLVLANKGEERKLKQFERHLKIEFEKTLVPSVEDIRDSKVEKWAKGILDAEINENLPEDVLGKALSAFEEMDKDDLIKKMVSIEMRSLTKKSNDDLNDFSKRGRDDAGGRSNRRERRDRDRGRRGERIAGDRGDRSERRGGRTNKGMQRYFINLGKMDNVGKKELIDFICDESGIKKSSLGVVTVEKRCSYFEVAKEETKTVDRSFKDVQVDGRELRVNRDR